MSVMPSPPLTQKSAGCFGRFDKRDVTVTTRILVGSEDYASPPLCSHHHSGGADLEIDQLPASSDGTPEHSATECH